MDKAPNPATRPRGRPPKPLETPEARIARLQAELRQAEAALQEAEARRVAIVGAAALRHAAHNPAFRRELVAMLQTEVTTKAERAVVAALLVEEPVPLAPPA